jgi:hypothetical protein
MIIPEQVFKNYSTTYGRNLSLNLVNNNIINENSLKIGHYYGFSGEGIIHKLSTSWETFHIVRYDGGLERGFLNIHCLFSLYFNINIPGQRIVHWIHGYNNNIIKELSNPKFYQLPKDNVRDMIYEDQSLDDDKKNMLVLRLNDEQLNNTPNLLCTICITNALNRVLPCGHTLCNTCVEHPGYHNCHMCRRTINMDDIRPLYFG